MKSLYLIGSLRNANVPLVAQHIRDKLGIEVFDDWYAAGPTADDCWRDYEKAKGNTYIEGLRGFAARHVFSFDKQHLDRCDAALLLLPAGKSGHLELGYVLGTGKPGYIICDPEVERWDVMYKFATYVYNNVDDFVTEPRLFGNA